MTAYRPADAAEAAEIVQWAAAAGEDLEIVAGGSKRKLGRPMHAAHRLDIAALSGIIDYDPPELVLTARAATPLAEIQSALAAQRQMLAFEPPAWHRLFGQDGSPTLGGVIACNLAGPRRIRAGAPRDHLLGFAAINGWGEIWKAGGKVVKNVSGYDMAKLHCGALGTLSLLTDVSLRVVPLPQTVCTLLIEGLTDATAIPLLAGALNSPFEVSAAAFLPAPLGRRCAVLRAAGSIGAVRIEGPAPSVADRAEKLAALLPVAARLDAAASATLWDDIGAVHVFLPPEGRVIWRVCSTPSAAPTLVAALRARLSSCEAVYDWAGGLVWLALDAAQAGEDAAAALVRAALPSGHATLIVAPEAIRAAVPVFQPAAAPLEALAMRVKASFDPSRVLNPGRMQSGR